MRFTGRIPCTGCRLFLHGDLLHGFHSLECLKRDPRFELRTVVSSLLFHVSVGFGYTPETLQKLTISLAPFQRAASVLAG